jgi:hypothetical protein
MTTQLSFSVEALRAAHAAPASPSPTPNFRRGTPQTAPSTPVAERRPTGPQRDLLKTLFAERAGNPEAERIRGEINAIMQAGGLTFEVVSATITDLKAIPKPAAVRGGAWTEVPDGRYAVPSATGNNDLDFFLVTTEDEEGDWFGFRRVERVIGGNPEAPVKGQPRRAALEAIVAAEYDRPIMTFEGREYGGGTYAGPEAAAIRYADTIGECGRCGRSLTKYESRAAGIGPVCAGKE